MAIVIITIWSFTNWKNAYLPGVYSPNLVPLSYTWNQISNCLHERLENLTQSFSMWWLYGGRLGVNRSFVIFAMQSRNLHNELNFPLRFKANNHLCTSEIEKLLSVRKCSGLPQCKTEFKASVNGSLSLTRILTVISNICTKIIGIFVLSWHVGSKKL